MRVDSIMTKGAVTVEPDDAVDVAIRLMDDWDIHHLPVVDRQGGLCGILSDRDLLTSTGGVLGGADDGARRVGDLMTKYVEVVDPSTEVTQVGVELLVGRFSGLPVVSEGVLVGMLTDVDLGRAYLRAIRDRKLAAARDPMVRELMTERVETIGPGTSLREALDLCRARCIRHVPVVDGDRVIGIVSDRDLRRAIGRHQLHDSVYRSSTGAPLTVAPDTRMSRAVEMMLESRIGSLPVTVDGDRLAGIITMSDVVDHAVNTLWEVESSPASMIVEEGSD